MEEIYLILASSVFWFLFYQLYLIKRVALEARREWVRWAVSDDGQDTLIDVLGAKDGVIDHIAAASGQLIRSMFEGGFGAAAKKLSADPKTAITQGIASQLKDMKWYESALLMKVAQQIPELQPLLGLVTPPLNASKTSDKPPQSLKQPHNL